MALAGAGAGAEAGAGAGAGAGGSACFTPLGSRRRAAVPRPARKLRGPVARAAVAVPGDHDQQLERCHVPQRGGAERTGRRRRARGGRGLLRILLHSHRAASRQHPHLARHGDVRQVVHCALALHEFMLAAHLPNTALPRHRKSPKSRNACAECVAGDMSSVSVISVDPDAGSQLAHAEACRRR